MSSNYCVYMHTTPSSKRYIGITCQKLNHRWRNGEGYKRCVAFYKAVQKYGWENIKHEVLLTGLSLSEANKAEKYYIEKYNTHNKHYGYNCTEGGEGVSGWKPNEEQREKNRQSKIKQWQDPDMRARLTKERQQRGANPKERERMKQLANEMWQDPEMRNKLEEHLRELAYDETLREKRSEKMKQHWTENSERFMKNRQYKTGAENKCSKPVRCIDTGKVYANARIAEAETGISYKGISGCANGRQKTAQGTRWEFAETA